MKDEIFKKAIETIKKFGYAFESRTDGSNKVAEYKMMITVDDGTSFIFEMEYDEEGELESKEKYKASRLADSKKAYIRYCEQQLKHGDWIGVFSGANDEHKVVPRCVALAYYDDGTPKRSVGVFYPDISAVWTKNMNETVFADMRNDTNYVPKKSGTVAITDKQFDSNI